MSLLADLDTLETKLVRLPAALRAELHRLVIQEAQYLLDFNRSYLKDGKDVNGQTLGDGSYSAAYASYKQKYGRYKQIGHIDLRFSGEFYESFLLMPIGDLIYEIIATDPKYDFLKSYGQLLGVRAQDLADFLQILIEPELREFVADYLKL